MIGSLHAIHPHDLTHFKFHGKRTSGLADGRPLTTATPTDLAAARPLEQSPPRNTADSATPKKRKLAPFSQLSSSPGIAPAEFDTHRYDAHQREASSSNSPGIRESIERSEPMLGAGVLNVRSEGSGAAGDSPSEAFAGVTIDSGSSVDMSGSENERDGGAIAGGGVKERAASPAKRSAREMEADHEDEEVTDFDMAIEELKAGPSTQSTNVVTTAQGSGSANTSATSLDSEELPAYSASGDSIATAELDRRVKEVQRIAQEPLNHGVRGMVVSKKWLARVLSRTSEKQQSSEFTKEARLGPIGPVDNSDITPPDGFAPPVLKDTNGHFFTPLKPGLQMGEDFEILPYEAWMKITGWYGSVNGQRAIARYAYDTAGDSGGTHLQFEIYPPVFTVRKVLQTARCEEEPEVEDKSRSAVNDLRLKHARKERGQMSADDALRVVSSRQEGYQKFLRRTKDFAGIPMARKVKLWRVIKPTISTEDAAVSAITSGTESSTSTAATTTPLKLVIDPQEWQQLGIGSDLEPIEVLDHTGNSNYNGKSTMESIQLSESQMLIFEEQTGGPGGGEFGSDTKKRLAPQTNRPGTTSKPASAPPSGRSSPAPGAGMMTRGRIRRDGRTKGTVGLGNLGNTCYMNSALQCIRSVEELAIYFLQDHYKKEINSNNVLGSKGIMAKRYAEVLQGIYGDNAGSSFTPTNFKKSLSNQNPIFSGWGQQDSQEFLSYLIDAIHEDLNRIEKKPYFENPDSDDKRVSDPEYIKELADVYQKHHDARNDSICMDLFSGFYKNTMECPVCAKISVTFDPFSSLTLQLPMENTFNHTFTFVPLNGPPINHDLDLEKSLTMKDVKMRIASKHRGVTADRLWMVEVYQSKIYKHFDDRTSLAEANIQSADFIFVYELSSTAKNIPPPTSGYSTQLFGKYDRDLPDMDTSEMAESFAVPVFQRKRDGRSDTHKNTLHPLYISITREEAKDYNTILKKVLLRVAQVTSHPILHAPNGLYKASSAVHQSKGNGEAENGVDETARLSDHSIPSEDGYVDVSVDDHITSPLTNGSSAPVSSAHPARTTAGVPKNFMDSSYKLNDALRNHMFMMNYTRGAENMLCTGLNGFEDKAVHAMKDRVKIPATSSSNESTSEEDADSTTASSPGNSASAESDEDGDEVPDSFPAVRSTEESTLSFNDGDDDELPDDPVASSAKPGGRRANGKENKFKGRSKKATRKERKLSKKEKKLRKAAVGVVGSSKPQRDDDEAYYIKLGEGIVIDWYPEAYDGLFCGSPDDPDGLRGHFLSDANGKDLAVMADPATTEKRKLRQLRQKNGITLDDCFAETGKREKLSEDNAWFCNRCKELRQATKTLEIWTCPDIVVVHLKRFGGTRSFRDKLDVMVDYPVEGLDLTDKIGQKADGKEYIYDLFAVDNHFGGLGGGHYTASARNFFDGQWYDYNDASCSKLGDAPRRSAAAYLLFYRRRSDKPLGPEYLQKIVSEYHNPPPPSLNPNTDEAYESDSGEGRLGDPTSILHGSSGQSLGAGVGAGTSSRTLQSRTGDLAGVGVGVAGRQAGQKAKPRSLGLSDDEGIDMGDDDAKKPILYGPERPPLMQAFGSQGNDSWGFDALEQAQQGRRGSADAAAADAILNGIDHDADSVTAEVDDEERAADVDSPMLDAHSEPDFTIGNGHELHGEEDYEVAQNHDAAQHIEDSSDVVDIILEEREE